MKVALVIDYLGSGGAQRQMLQLAAGLSSRGHECRLFTYHDGGLFGRSTSARDIDVVSANVTRHRRFSWLRRELAAYSPDIIQTYLSGPNMLAEVVSLSLREPRLVVSERNTPLDCRRADANWIATRMLHHSADWVTCNSFAALAALRQVPGDLARKSSVIWNGVDDNLFRGSSDTEASGSRRDPFRFLCVAAHRPSKNGVGLMRALGMLRNQTDRAFSLTWLGNQHSPLLRPCFEATEAAAEQAGIRPLVSFVDEHEHVTRELLSHDALVLASHHEGMPNVLCEAMAVGVLCVASAVSDVPILLGHGERGLLCHSGRPDSISRAMLRAMRAQPERSRAMKARAMAFARANLSLGQHLDRYEALYTSLLR